MRTDHVGRLIDHLWWADDVVGRTLQVAENVPEKAILLYAHVLAAELIWLDRIEQAEQSVQVFPETDREGCSRLAREARQRYEAFMGRLDTLDLTAKIHYTNTTGTAFATPLEDILLHVCLHGAYHRGQIAQLIRGAGEQPGVTDYIAFVRSRSPSR